MIKSIKHDGNGTVIDRFVSDERYLPNVWFENDGKFFMTTLYERDGDMHLIVEERYDDMPRLVHEYFFKSLDRL